MRVRVNPKIGARPHGRPRWVGVAAVRTGTLVRHARHPQLDRHIPSALPRPYIHPLVNLFSRIVSDVVGPSKDQREGRIM